MANFSGSHLLFFSVIIATGTLSVVSGTVFTIVNSCSFNVWPGVLTGNGAQLNDGGFLLTPGASVDLTAPAGWSGRIWGRTGCNFDGSGAGRCLTGDCGNKLKCAGAGGVPPVTLAEFTIGNGGGQDFYDVSLVDGYNVQMGITTRDGSGDCQNVGCVSDLNGSCPNELRVMDGGNVVACKSACAAFNKPEYCCTGAFDKPETCPPTDYSRIFKAACPKAYSYAYDDASSTFTCTNANYSVVFCPKS
ncbi:unnamed protein product [Brassica oleracea var. botrytis]|uniref:(rape) hypothetical protein n=1 Tax=Brassica napus TaxID=3708 RepID=A0A078HT58_BRANA|nr:unnamed protein product [Brassica napus]CDY41037.1 BnaC05g14950D [Brassica napus]